MELFLNTRDHFKIEDSLKPHSYLIDEVSLNHNFFKNQKNAKISTFVGEINSQLSSKKKYEALHTLLLFLPQCSYEILVENAEKWFRLVTGVCS